MNMKVTLNKKMSSRIFKRAPINFWEPPKVEEDSMTKLHTKIISVMRQTMIFWIRTAKDTKSTSILFHMEQLNNG
jgi:hypothetical protein